jgi:hypothetical protein
MADSENPTAIFANECDIHIFAYNVTVTSDDLFYVKFRLFSVCRAVTAFLRMAYRIHTA